MAAHAASESDSCCSSHNLGTRAVYRSAAITGTAWSVSFAHAFEALLQFPAGQLLLTILALGLIALGLHSFGGARWIRMRPPVLISRR